MRQVIKQRLGAYNSKIKWAYVVLFLGMLFLHKEMTYFGDDFYFLEASKSQDWFAFLQMRYATWSSRMLIEIVTLWVMTKPLMLWKIIDSGIMVLLAYSVEICFLKSSSKKNAWFVAFALLLYPIFHMSTAGWVTTSINYMWPVALGLYAMIPIRRRFEGKNNNLIQIIATSAALIFACSNEQVALVSVVVWGYFFVYFLLKEKKVNSLGWYFACALGCFWVIVNSACLEVRFLAEVKTWFPNFESLNLADKLSLGFSTTLLHFVSLPNFVFLVFVLVLLASCYRYKKKWLWRFSPVVALIVMNLMGTYNAALVIQNRVVEEKLFMTVDRVYGIRSMANIESFDYSYLYLSSGLLLVFFGIIAYQLYVAREKYKDGFPLIGILCLGFSVRVIMGFSPTIYASSLRTFIMPYISLMIVTLVLLEGLWEALNQKAKRCVEGVFIGFCLLSYMVNLGLVHYIQLLKS